MIYYSYRYEHGRKREGLEGFYELQRTERKAFAGIVHLLGCVSVCLLFLAVWQYS